MGRIKSTLVKRTSRKMLAEENVFTEKFDDNKLVLGSSMPSKKVKNMIAGYLARLKRRSNKEKAELLGKAEEEED
jgi:ribosomal protein S17E